MKTQTVSGMLNKNNQVETDIFYKSTKISHMIILIMIVVIKSIQSETFNLV